MKIKEPITNSSKLRIRKIFRVLLTVQTIYYSITAIWPIIDMKSFMLVTGPKTDTWLVITVAFLLLAISLSFFVQLLNMESDPRPVMMLAIACCVFLAGIDIYYTATGVIRPVYLLDAVIEIILLGFWTWILVFNRKHPGKQRYK